MIWMRTRKGIAFTAVFVLMFLLLMPPAVLITESAQRREAARASDSLPGATLALKDISSDIALFYADVSATHNETATRVTFADQLPSPLSSPDGAVEEYARFINGTYANETNTNASIVSLSPEMGVSPGGLAYAYDGFGKRHVTLGGSNDVYGYIVSVRLNESCAPDCAGAATYLWNWTAGPGGVYIYMDIRDKDGGQVYVGGTNGGFVDTGSPNILNLALASGSYYLALGNDTSPYLVQRANGVRAQTNTTVILRGNAPVRVFVPADVRVRGMAFDELTLYEG